MGKHADGEPRDVDYLAGVWHIGLSFPGMFPWFEQTCECPKAPCGLVVPVATIPCAIHHGQRPIRVAHRSDECRRRKF